MALEVSNHFPPDVRDALVEIGNASMSHEMKARYIEQVVARGRSLYTRLFRPADGSDAAVQVPVFVTANNQPG